MSSKSFIHWFLAPGSFRVVISSEIKCLVPISCLAWLSCFRNILSCFKTLPQSSVEPGRSTQTLVLASSGGEFDGDGLSVSGAGQDSAPSNWAVAKVCWREMINKIQTTLMFMS